MMTLNMESLFLVLSGVILAAGVLYWFWSHIQLTQKKVQLLENAVFELRGMLRPEAPVAPPPTPAPASTEEVPATAAAYQDLPDDNWSDAGEESALLQSETPRIQVSEDLQPGGRAFPANERAFPSPPSPPKEATPPAAAAAAEFRELFVSSGPIEEPKNEALDAMPVKELRRLAEQRGIQGTADMKKKEILSALRQQIVPAPVVKEEEVKSLDIALEEVPVLE
jgi:hypothetical protein